MSALDEMVAFACSLPLPAYGLGSPAAVSLRAQPMPVLPRRLRARANSAVVMTAVPTDSDIRIRLYGNNSTCEVVD